MKCEIVVEAIYGQFEGNLMRAHKLPAGAILEGPEWYIESLIRAGMVRTLSRIDSERESVQNQPENAENPPQEAAQCGVDTDHPFFDAGLKFAAVVALVEAGFHTWADVEQTADDDLLAVDGIGPATLRRLRAWLESQT